MDPNPTGSKRQSPVIFGVSDVNDSVTTYRDCIVHDNAGAIALMLIGFLAYEDVVDDPPHEQELTGHYVDGVELTLRQTDQ